MQTIKKILITGGAGFLGSHLARRIIQQEGYEVIIFDIHQPPDDLKNKVKYVCGDITKKSDVFEVCKEIDIIYHTAALVPISRAGKLFYKTNVEGTRNVLEASMAHKVKRLIHLSSSSVYGIPSEFPLNEESPLKTFGTYAKTKLEAEKLCFEYINKGLNICIIRPRTIVGKGRLGIIAVLLDWVQAGKKIYTVGSGENHYQLVSPSDLAEACILAAEKDFNGIINIGAEEYGTLKEDLKGLVQYAQTGSKIVSVPSLLIRPILWVLDVFKLSPFVYWHYLTLDKEYAFDIKKAKEVLNWKPEKSNVGCLKEAYDWYLENHIKFKQGNNHTSVPKQKLIKVVKFFS